MQDRVALIDWTLLPPNSSNFRPHHHLPSSFQICLQTQSPFSLPVFFMLLMMLVDFFDVVKGLSQWGCGLVAVNDRLTTVRPFTRFSNKVSCRLISSIVLLLFVVSLLRRYYSKRDATHISEHHFLRRHNYTFRNLYILINVPSFLQKWYKSKSSLSLFDY